MRAPNMIRVIARLFTAYSAVLLCLLSAAAADTRTLSFTNTAQLTFPSVGAATPYPSRIELSGVPGTISQVKVTLNRLQHTFPDDIDVLLVGPTGGTVLLLSDRGSTFDITNVNLTFDDQAASFVPDSAQIVSGTFKPSNDATSDLFPAPAPAPPHGANFAAFAGTNPNGTWSLYADDDTSGDVGAMQGGWSLTITTTNLTASGSPGQADLSVTLTDSPDPALTEQPLTLLSTVINSGPASATSVVLTNTIPATAGFVSAASSQGSFSQTGAVVVCNLGTLSSGAVATVSVVVTPITTNSLVTSATVQGTESDPSAANNTATATTLVNEGPPSLTVSDIVVTERTAWLTNANFPVTMSHAAQQTVTVSYSTTNGTASAGSDYYGITGILSFPPGTTNLYVSTAVLGDSTVESNETFSLQLSGPVNAIISRPQAQATILNDDGVAGAVDHFVWNSLSATQYQSELFPVTISAVDAFGGTATGFTGTVSVTGLTGSGTNSLRLLLTEVDINEDGIELANVSSFPVDLTGWSIAFYDWTFWPDPALTFGFPSGSIAPAASVFTVRENGAAPGSFPSFFLGQNLGWLNETSSNQVAVLLLDPAGQIADFFCAVDGSPTQITRPLPISTNQWSGNPAPANTVTSLTYQRTGAVDRNTNSDWQLVSGTMGATNSGLTLPFAGPRPVSVTPTSSGNFIAGVWSGSLAVTEVVTNMTLRADDGDGHLGTSQAFRVDPSTDLSLTHTGQLAQVSVGQDITFTLQVTNRGPITASNVTIVDTLSSRVTFKSASTTQGTVAHLNGVVTATIGTLAVSNKATVTVVVTAVSSGGATNSAVVSTSTRDYQATNNSASAGVWINYPPTISAIPTTSINEDSPTTINFTVQDVESPPGTLAVSASSSNTGLVPNGNLVLGGSGANRTLTISPQTNQFGTTSISLQVTDSQDSSSTNFLLIVNSVNDAPMLAAVADRTLNEGSTLTITNSASDADLPPNVLTFSLIAGPSGATLTSAGVLTWSTTESDGPSTNVFTVRVTDNGSPNLSDTRSFTVVVQEVNTAPTLAPVGNRTINEGSSLTITNLATDIDLPTNTLSFTLLNAPSGATVTSNGIVTWTPPSGYLPSSNTVTVRVADDGAPSLSATGSFQVIVNHLPVPGSPAVERFIPGGVKVALTDLLGSDSDNDSLALDSLNASSQQGVAVTNRGQWVFYSAGATFTNADSFGYQVGDGRGGLSAGTVTVTVKTDTNSTPSSTVEDLQNGSYRAHFSGIPGYTYRVEASASLETPAWQSVGLATADSLGFVAFVDSPPGGNPRYYRITPANLP